MNASLFEQPLASVSGAPVFAGSDFDSARDEKRLVTQLGCILTVVVDERWWTITRLVMELRRRYPRINFPENSVQAQLRNLRKLGYRVSKENVAKTGVLFAYQVLPPVNPGVGQKIREAKVA